VGNRGPDEFLKEERRQGWEFKLLQGPVLEGPTYLLSFPLPHKVYTRFSKEQSLKNHILLSIEGREGERSHLENCI
jgi:hypothetical protein